MTISVINYTNKLYEIYSNNDDVFSNIIIKKTNNVLLSVKKDIMELKLKKDYITEKEVADIYQILTKLSFVSRVNFIKCINDIKKKDFTLYKELKHSKHIIDYALKNIVKILIESEKNIDIHKNFLNNDIISHTNRVFFTIIKFIKYYNSSINNNIVSNIKKNFRKRYLEYYKSVLKKFNINKNISKLEDVYKYGLREIFTREIIEIAISSFWHDIANISINLISDYYSNSDDVLYHAEEGYSYLKYFINYNDSISLIVGMHNEYFGYGKGIFLDYYNTVNNKASSCNPNYIVSFEYNDILKLGSISYFHSKVLEIVDLFDKYNELNSKKALEYIRENYLEKEVKVDPIIFDIFSSFILSENKLIA